MTIVFDEAHEIEVLRACAHDSGYFHRATSILKQHLFVCKPHGWVFHAMLKQFKEHHEMPTLLYVKSRAEQDFTDADTVKEHMRIVESIFNTKPQSATSSLSLLEEYVKHRNMANGVEVVLNQLAEGDIAKAYSEMHKVLASGRLQTYDASKWIEEYDQRQAERKHRRQYPHLYPNIPTRIKALDRIIGGIQKGELGLVGATTNRGKSIFMTHLGFMAAAMGWNVLHFSLEMPADQVATRYDARLLKIPHRAIKLDQLNPEQRVLARSTVERRHKHLKNKVFIVAFPVRTCTILDIRGVIEQRHAVGVPPDLVLVDSGDHMLPVKSYANFRLDTASVFWDLKSLAGDPLLGCGVWSTTQLKQEVVHKIGTAEAVSEAYDKSRIADILVTLNQDTEQEKMMPPEIDLWLAKFRDGESKRMVKLKATLSKMLFEEVDQIEVREDQ